MDSNRKAIEDTLYLCNFRVSVNGEWLCLKELNDVEYVPKFEIENCDNSKVRLETRDPVFIERNNLVNIIELVVKELIDQSLSYGRMLDSDHLPLTDFFIVLEHILGHGLKIRKTILGPKKELWDVFQTIQKYSQDARSITLSVRDLPTVRTHMGRARAWIRLALMQKKLGDYLQILVNNKDETLTDYYEPEAFVLNGEMHTVIGLLNSLNVIDFNLCVKQEDLDRENGIIDFSLYLRSAKAALPNAEDVNKMSQTEQSNAMNTILDQKNYIEELNRKLNTTVSGLQTKLESMSANNTFLKEDLEIAKSNLIDLLEENRKLKQLIGKPKILQLLTDRYKRNSSGSSGQDQNATRSECATGADYETLKKLEKELELQLCVQTELADTVKKLEKSNNEKQDTIVNLTQQLDNIKLINFELYKKLQECEIEINQKTEIVVRLQEKATQISEMLGNLDKYNLETSVVRVPKESIPHSKSFQNTND